jgi:hypothetical protein
MADPTIKDLLSRSTLAFTATVVDVGASPLPDVEADERTVVADVSDVLRAPPEVGLAPGARVTVQLSPELSPLAPGEEATFFADAWLYGEELAVSEVGRSAPADAAERTERLAPTGDEEDRDEVSAVEAGLAELAQDEIIDHAREADAIVRGVVIGLNHVPTTGPPREHDAQYWIATFRVDLVAKGAPDGLYEEGGELRCLYANSLDVRWRDHPKPKAGQGGLWMLHNAPDELASIAPFELVHPIDRQDSIQLDLLREHGI